MLQEEQSLRDEIGQTRLIKGWVLRKKATNKGRCSLCMGRADCLCCTHLINTSFFTSRSGKAEYEIRHHTNSGTKKATYLGFCMKCNAHQYIGKIETQGANKRVSKHHNDVCRPDGLVIDCHVDKPDHHFNRDFLLIIIEEISKGNLTREQMRKLLLNQQHFLILKLGTLEPNGFNDKLNLLSEARAN